jgi:hypothetical protein
MRSEVFAFRALFFFERCDVGYRCRRFGFLAVGSIEIELYSCRIGDGYIDLFGDALVPDRPTPSRLDGGILTIVGFDAERDGDAFSLICA